MFKEINTFIQIKACMHFQAEAQLIAGSKIPWQNQGSPTLLRRLNCTHNFRHVTTWMLLKQVYKRRINTSMYPPQGSSFDLSRIMREKDLKIQEQMMTFLWTVWWLLWPKKRKKSSIIQRITNLDTSVEGFLDVMKIPL